MIKRGAALRAAPLLLVLSSFRYGIIAILRYIAETLNQSYFQSEHLLFDPATPDHDAVNIVFAFPNTYTVGITSLGYQGVWANLATRSQINVSRWFTDAHEDLPRKIEILGQFGRFSGNFLDYTGFNLSFSQGLVNGQSPFFFDRFVDQQTMSYGITQQVYGPIRVGFQSIYSIDQAKEISTEYFLEWSRRTYSLILRYNPVLQLGILNIRVSDFNWTGNPGYFEGSDVRPVVDGVTR